MIKHTIETIRAKCDEVGDCWEWAGGYGNTNHPYVRHDGGNVLVRRLVAQLAGKTLTAKTRAVASCNNPRCVNPAHVAVQTHQQVMARQGAIGNLSDPLRIAKIAATKRASSQAKLTWEQVTAIRASDATHLEEAKKHGVHPSKIASIRQYRCWKEFSDNPWLGLGARA